MPAGRKTMLVVGASGVVGRAALEHFGQLADWDVVGVSRRVPQDLDGATLLSLDLLDTERCADTFAAMPAVTHVIYAALSEAPGLVSGWRDHQQMQRNLTMLRNVLDRCVVPRGHSNTSRCCRARRPTASTSK